MLCYIKKVGEGLIVILSSFKDGGNYVLGIRSPGKKQESIHVFPTYEGYREYLYNYKSHLKYKGHQFLWEEGQL